MSGGGGGVGIEWPIWAELLLAFVILCLGAFFAGCTLGLLALDKVGLQIVASAGSTEKDRHNASANTAHTPILSALTSYVVACNCRRTALAPSDLLPAFGLTCWHVCRKNHTAKGQGQLAAMHASYRKHSCQL